MRAGARDPQAFRLEQLGEGDAELAELLARLLDVLADRRPDLDDRLHHLALHLVAELRGRGREERVDVRAQLAARVDDLVLLLDADRQQALAAHQRSSTNVGTTLPAPAVTLRSAAAETRVMKPAGRPSNR